MCGVHSKGVEGARPLPRASIERLPGIRHLFLGARGGSGRGSDVTRHPCPPHNQDLGMNAIFREMLTVKHVVEEYIFSGMDNFV